MKNQTKTAILWKGEVYHIGQEIPEAIAKEINLALLNKAVQGDGK